jgi:regulator of protease activity HflC (stomatin/prohibitin superfamily)
LGAAGIVLLLVVLVALALTVRVVPAGHAGIVERMGRYSRTTGSGWAVIDPFGARLRALVDLRERAVTPVAEHARTADGATVRIEAEVRFAVVDPVRATYEVPDLARALEDMGETVLHGIAGELALEDALSARSAIAGALRTALEENTPQWGIRIDGVEVRRADVMEHRGPAAVVGEE